MIATNSARGCLNLKKEYSLESAAVFISALKKMHKGPVSPGPTSFALFGFGTETASLFLEWMVSRACRTRIKVYVLDTMYHSLDAECREGFSSVYQQRAFATKIMHLLFVA
jgi:hypothetical protein